MCEIAGPGASAEILDLSRQIAEAQIDLCRVRYARHQLLSRALADPYYETRAAAEGSRQAAEGKSVRKAPAKERTGPGTGSPRSPRTMRSPFDAGRAAQVRNHLIGRGYWRWIAMNGERCRDANLPFEPSIRPADGILAIAIIECATVNLAIANFGRAKNGEEAYR
jgi:antitoxin VapB